MPIQASPHTSQLLKLSGPADGGRLGHGDGGLRTMSTETVMHWQVPTSATSNLAQSREADDSCMFPLSDPE